MGLLDILNSVQNAPRGQPQPQPASGGGGLSPLALALLGLLAYKAIQGGGLGNILGGGQQPAPAGGDRPTAAPTDATAGSGAGGLGDILGGLLGGAQARGGSARPASPGAGGLGDILGGLLSGGQPGQDASRSTSGGSAGGAGDILGGLLSGGLGNLLKDLQKSGQGDVAKSWLSNGPNQEIEPEQLGEAVGTDTLDTLAKQTGMPREQLLTMLSQYLPGFVDKLTPNGRVPSEQEAARFL